MSEWLKVFRMVWLLFLFLDELGHAVSSSLLHIRIPPGDGHWIPGMGVVFDYIEARAPALCILNCSPSVHVILNAAVQICCSSSPFCRFAEGAKETVVGSHVIAGCDKLGVVLLYHGKKVM
jgi:hypothetical protein